MWLYVPVRMDAINTQGLLDLGNQKVNLITQTTSAGTPLKSILQK